MCSVVHVSSRRTRRSVCFNARPPPRLGGFAEKNANIRRMDGSPPNALEERALAALDRDALAADASELVRVPSVTGDERAVVERFGRLARGRGLVAQTHVHDLAALRADPGYPGEEAARSALFGASAVLRGRDPAAPRLCLNGHLDVVAPGNEEWSRDPWSGDLADGRLHGRGAVDMKGAVTAALHALAAVAAAGGSEGDVV